MAPRTFAKGGIVPPGRVRLPAGLHLLKAEILNADGVISITCQADDTVTVRDGDQFLDITPVLDR